MEKICEEKRRKEDLSETLFEEEEEEEDTLWGREVRGTVFWVGGGGKWFKLVWVQY